MIERTVAGHKLVFYDSVEDLPIVQFHRYSKFLLVESGVGDNINDIDRHITKIFNFFGDRKKMQQELLNLRQCLYVIATEQDIHNKATLCLVRSVDGKVWEDFSDKVFEDSLQKNYTDLLRRKALLQIASIVKDEDNKEQIEAVDASIYRMQNPKGFMGQDSEEVRFDKQFEDMCLLMAKEFGGGIKKYTTMEFYAAFERLTRQYNEAKKLRNKR